ncbi:hypothetical protein DPX16_0376 [Anabarilius grahami]|uniref:Uncharacterized protein n=1 Tax=Anabarilius grahami TaxID=495550 RepID=A0A3N0YV01_ANAGA|nr:hypothetical protein DPX16_0376 [Anabarilius grahami]
MAAALLQMPRHSCGTCRAPLHDSDGHSECVACLGKSHADGALAGASCPHCECMSPGSLRSRVAEQKGYEHLPPLDEAVAAHLCPPAAVGWKTKRALPSKPCRTTSTLAGRAYTSAGQAASALHTMAIFQVFQAKLLRSLDESGIDAPAFKDLRKATDLALRATKATAQAIGRSMASLVVLERHLWLNLTEIKDLDKTAFLDAPVSPSGLFGSAVEGFTFCPSASALLLLQAAPGLRQLSRTSQLHPPLKQHHLRSIASANALQSALPSRDARDPGPRLCWTR